VAAVGPTGDDPPSTTFALLRAFRDETGLPPHAYLNQLRVRRARRLLDGGLAPALVAVQAGFADQAHLTRHFKRVVGLPPGAYQRERETAPAVPPDLTPGPPSGVRPDRVPG
jgi:AraC-like DNA-binding protein